MRRATFAIVALGSLAPLVALASTSIVGWVGVPLTEESAVTTAVTNVIGQADSAAAETLLVADGFVLGAVTPRCSSAAADEVVGQSPAPGVLAAAGAAVDLLVSNGVECPQAGRPGVRLKGLRFPGL